MNLAYVRVSSVDQNEARQIETLKKYDIEKWFIEKASAKDSCRLILQQLLDFAREGDTIYIADFSRLARSVIDLLHIVDKLTQKNIKLISAKENLDTGTSTGKLMLTMIGAINEFERANILERQREGIVLAKRAGKYKGGQKKKIDQEQFKNLYQKYMKREITKVEMARKLGITRPTLEKRIKDFHNNGFV